MSMMLKKINGTTKTARRCYKVGALLAATLVVASCAGDPHGRPTTGAPTTSSTSTSSTTPPTTTSSTQAESLEFQRRNAPPSGIARQVSFYLGAGDADPECYYSQPLPARNSPYLALAEGSDQEGAPLPPKRNSTIEVFAGAELCLVGFVPNSKVALRVTAPDGEVERKSVIAKQYEVAGLYHYHSGYYFRPRPKDPVGAYDVVATQGGRRASFIVTVVPSSEPKLAYSVSEGEIEVSGLKPRQPLALNFYGGRDMASLKPDPSAPGLYLLPYLGTMQVNMDVNGQLALPWPVALRRGCYGVDFKGYKLEKPVQCDG
jgi:hypothetical protein